MGSWTCGVDAAPGGTLPFVPQPQSPNGCSGLCERVGLWDALSSIRRSACSTRALRSPLGPFFFGTAKYAHCMLAFLHGVHGSTPSHRTFRFRQQSQALLTSCFTDVPALLLSPLVYPIAPEVGGCAACASVSGLISSFRRDVAAVPEFSSGLLERCSYTPKDGLDTARATCLAAL